LDKVGGKMIIYPYPLIFVGNYQYSCP
jgi:hypothetical protein